MRCDLCSKKCNKGEPCEVRDSASLYDADDRAMLRTTNEMNRLTRGQFNRLQEIIEFAKRMGYTRVGMAFCVSLSEEAVVAAKILAPHFELHTVCCKTAGMLDDVFDAEPRTGKVPVSCNPAEQARILAENNTQLNIVMGLCVGHDSIFYKHSQAPCTTFVVKDRVLGHNPAVALTCSFIRSKMLPRPQK